MRDIWWEVDYARLGLAVADERYMVRGSSLDFAIMAVFDVSVQQGVWGIIKDEVGLTFPGVRLLSSKAEADTMFDNPPNPVMLVFIG